MHTPVLPFLCLLIAGALLICGCSVLVKTPEVSVQEVALSSVNLTDLSLDVTLAVNNPNSFGITLKSLSFDVYYLKDTAWVYLSHGEQAGIQIPPGMSTITIPVTIKNADLLGSLISFVSQGEITIQIRGVASPDIFGIAPSVPFTHTTTVPLRIGTQG
jgi:LEA14-like dessication related protein